MWDMMAAVKIMGIRRFFGDFKTRAFTKVGISPLFSAKLNPNKLTITVPRGVKPEKFFTMSSIMILSPLEDKRFTGRRMPPLMGCVTERSMSSVKKEVRIRMRVRKKNKKAGWGR